MKAFRAQLLVVGWLALLVSGCVVGRVHRDRPLDEQKIAAIERGVTTRNEILQVFGPPQEVVVRDLVAFGQPAKRFTNRPGDNRPVEHLVGEQHFRYTYSRANAFGIILLAFNYAEFDQKNDTLLIFFDENDVVEDYAFGKDTDLLPRFGFLSR